MEHYFMQVSFCDNSKFKGMNKNLSHHHWVLKSGRDDSQFYSSVVQNTRAQTVTITSMRPNINGDDHQHNDIPQGNGYRKHLCIIRWPRFLHFVCNIIALWV